MALMAAQQQRLFMAGVIPTYKVVTAKAHCEGMEKATQMSLLAVKEGMDSADQMDLCLRVSSSSQCTPCLVRSVAGS